MADQRDHLILIERADIHHGLIVLMGFLALLFWWVGIASYVYMGGIPSGGAGLFVCLSIPVLATIATYLAGRRRKHTTSKNSSARHRSDD